MSDTTPNLSSSHDAPQEPAEAVVRGDNLDQAVDTLAALLRDFGRHALELPKQPSEAFHKLCETWAKHVLYATPAPGEPEARTNGGKRDWHELRLFFAQRRRAEYDYATQSHEEMNQVVWACLRELNHSLRGDQRADDRLQFQLERLQETVQSSDLAAIQRAVLSSAETMTQIIEERKQEQKLLLESLYQQIRDLDSQLEEARIESSLDPLTRLYNRKAFDTYLARTLDIAALFEESACLLLIDVDYFKTINDSYGHLAGDAVLRQLADCLTRTFPHKWEHIARYGGEEFAVILRDATLADGDKLAERLRRSVEQMPISYESHSISLTVSIGLATPQPKDTPQNWLDRADRALYAAKRGGRNIIQRAA